MLHNTPATIPQQQSNSSLPSTTEVWFNAKNQLYQKTKRHFLTQTCFFYISSILSDYTEIKALGVQRDCRIVLLLLFFANPQQEHCFVSISCVTGNPHLPFSISQPQNSTPLKFSMPSDSVTNTTILHAKQLQTCHGLPSVCKTVLQKVSPWIMAKAPASHFPFCPEMLAPEEG